MKISRFKPTLELQPYIYEYILVDIPRNLVVEKCLPDGFMKLFIYTGKNRSKYHDKYGNTKDWGDGFGGHPIDEEVYISSPEQIEGVVCTFKPQGLYHLFKTPAQHFNNNILSIDTLMGNEGKLLKEQLQEAVNEVDKVRILNQHFCKRVGRAGSMTGSPIAYAQQLIMTNNGIINIDQLAASISITRRSLERNFMVQVGTTPKYFARILRFNFAMKQKHAHPSNRWQDIIFNCGYFDQSHFIKEFKHFTGVAPEMFFDQERLLVNVCGGDDLKERE